MFRGLIGLDIGLPRLGPSWSAPLSQRDALSLTFTIKDISKNAMKDKFQSVLNFACIQRSGGLPLMQMELGLISAVYRKGRQIIVQHALAPVILTPAIIVEPVSRAACTCLSGDSNLWSSQGFCSFVSN